MTDALTGLERILTTPIPFSYRIHLWLVTIIYCLALPFQLWDALHWLTIPFTTIVSFIFFGFLVAGEEIENPFGYDKNDLNMDHFTHAIIRNELRAMTARPPPNVTEWAFSPLNDRLLVNNFGAAYSKVSLDNGARDCVPPEEWVKRGLEPIRASLASQ